MQAPKITHLESVLVGYEETIDDLRRQLDSVQQDNHLLESKVVGLNTDVGGLNSDIAELRQKEEVRQQEELRKQEEARLVKEDLLRKEELAAKEMVENAAFQPTDDDVKEVPTKKKKKFLMCC